ncbi:MAG: homoserine dehydrogenase, partial [Desulfobacterota bacterium]|nr:homoserine dehydrogenase [Thermodesulfobacteriota bacterium]
LIRQRIGVPIELKRVADIDIQRNRGVTLPDGVLTKDTVSLLHDPDIDIIIELIGGIEPARSFILDAIKNRKHVVTANKALLSEHGHDLFRTAVHAGVDLAFEASVCGSIPIIRAVQEGFSADRIKSFLGIFNGTANYILSRMTSEGAAFEEALRDAQKKGFAEADPTLDIEGIDTLHKLCVLLSLAFGKRVHPRHIYTEGISKITPLDIEFSRELGYKIKLLAICRKSGNQVDARVHPTLIPEQHMLSRVEGTFNAVFVETEDAGPAMFYGRGAGMMPTASAVVADVISLARNITKGISQRIPLFSSEAAILQPIRIRPFKEIISRYYMRFSAVDKPGVLSKISGVLGRNHISIHSVVQKGRQTRGGSVPIFMLTHEAREADMQKALAQLDRLSLLRQKTMVIRIEDALPDA